MKRTLLEATIQFEAATQTALASMINEMSSIDQLEKTLDVVLADVKDFAEVNGYPHPDRKTWEIYRKATDWEALAKKLAIAPETRLAKVVRKAAEFPYFS